MMSIRYQKSHTGTEKIIASDVSVIVPAFNAEKTIESTIQSVLDNTFLPGEVLIFNDASTDRTKQILENIRDQNPDIIHILSTNTNVGPAKARQKLLNKAKGKVIAFLDSDDLWYPDKLKQQIHKMNDKQADIVTSAYDIINENGNLVGKRIAPANISRMKMYVTNWLPMSMTIVKTSLISSKSMPNLAKRQDYAYWLVLFKLNKIKAVSCKEVHGKYLRRKNSVSSHKLKNLKFNFLVFKKILGHSFMLSLIFVFLNILVRLFRK